MLVVGCSAPELRVDNKYLMAGPHTYCAHVDVPTAGTFPVGNKRYYPPA